MECNKPCSPDKICNKKSGRCVSRTGKIGKNILAHKSPKILPEDLKKKSPQKISVKRKKISKPSCSADKILNPESGRCVSRTGKIGKKLLAKHSPKRKSPSPKKKLPTENIFNLNPIIKSLNKGILINKDFLNFIASNIRGYKIKYEVGRGDYGIVYLIQKDNSTQQRILKISYLDDATKIENFKKEVIMQRKLATLNLAPTIYNPDTFLYSMGYNGVGIIVMEKINNTLAEVLSNKLSFVDLETIYDGIAYLISELCLYGIVHGDFHPGNLGIDFVYDSSDPRSNYEGFYASIKMIDFGTSCCEVDKYQCIPKLELMKLIRGLMINLFPNRNKEYLLPRLIHLYNNDTHPPLMHPINFDISIKSIESLIDTLSISYKERYNNEFSWNFNR